MEEIIGKTEHHIDALDIALFGRMVAQAATMNVEAAASFAHAISTHKVTNEVEFFTALDDDPTVQVRSHGSWNSTRNLLSLCEPECRSTMADPGRTECTGAVECFVKALFVAVPSARQATQSGALLEFARFWCARGSVCRCPLKRRSNLKTVVF